MRPAFSNLNGGVMKKILFCLISALFLLLIASIGSGHNNSAPSLECAICHHGEFKPEIVKIEGLPKSYKPSKVYKFTVSVASDLQNIGEVAGGFAVETSAGQLVVVDDKNTQLSNGVLTHTQEGSAHRKWTLGWKAPLEKKNVVFTVMVVAANGDFSSMGDVVGAGSYTIKVGE